MMIQDRIRIVIALCFIYGVFEPSDVVASVPRSCEESLAFGNNYTGIHRLQSLDGANYTAFCQFDVTTHTGLTFVSKYAVEYNELDIDLMFTDRHYAVVRILNNDDTQSDTVVRQLPQYADTLLGIQQSAAVNYTYPQFTGLYGRQFLQLGFLRADQANNRGMIQGWTSNGIEIAYNNCDANPNNYMVFYPDLGVGSKPNYTEYSIVKEYSRTVTPTELENYLADAELFNYTIEMHFGGCGALACSKFWPVKGLALGIPFKSIQCPAPPCILFATKTEQASYYPGDKVVYTCIHGYTATTTPTVRCGINGQWMDTFPTCIRNRPGNHDDRYKGIGSPQSWPCPLAVSDVIPNVTRLRCAKLCTEQSRCMMFAVDGASCILTNGIVDSMRAFSKYVHWYAKQ